MGPSRTALRARMTAIAAVAALLAFAAVAGALARHDPPPQTTITKAPKDRIKVRGSRTATATWEFTADQPATFNCKFTGRGLIRPCTSPITFAGLTRGATRSPSTDQRRQEPRRDSRARESSGSSSAALHRRPVAVAWSARTRELPAGRCPAHRKKGQMVGTKDGRSDESGIGSTATQGNPSRPARTARPP